YDNTLIGWATNQDITTGLTIGVQDLKFCNGEAARNVLLGKGWTFDGDGMDPTCVPAGNPFITEWVATDGEITIPTFPGETYDYNIVWTNLDQPGIGEGSFQGATGNYTISGLENDDTYQVEITGDFPRIYFPGSGFDNSTKLKEVTQWGDIQWTSMES